MPAGGHCLCQEVGWEYDGEPDWVAHCHCESCRRTCSAAVVTFVGVPRSAFRMTGAAPRVCESSPGVRRLFCATCGSPVAYDADRDTAAIHRV